MVQKTRRALLIADRHIVYSFIDGQGVKEIAQKNRGYRTSLPTVSKIIKDFQKELAA